jgi:integrase/recombinase XerD
MTGLRQHLADYLAVRRAVRFKLARTELLLNDFVDYLEDRDSGVVTNAMSIAWASLPPVNAASNWHAHRLSVVRVFARYLHVIDPVHEIPPPKVFPTPNQRATPFIYADADVAAMMLAARGFANPLRAASMEAVIGLLAVSGIRIGEALRLDRAHVDLDNGLLWVFDSKFGKDRLVPIHPSTSAALTAYSTQRDQLSPQPTNPAMFVSAAGTRMLYCNFHNAWLTIVARAGIHARSAKCRPRPHDLRHTFAVSTIEAWYRNGDDVTANLPALSTILGHAHPRDTYWYLTGSPELLAIVVDRLDAKNRERS